MQFTILLIVWLKKVNIAVTWWKNILTKKMWWLKKKMKWNSLNVGFLIIAVLIIMLIKRSLS